MPHAQGKTILVVPGVELSTPQGHLLVYCPTFESLQGFFGKLTITPDRRTCHETIPQCLSKANDFGGFGIAAHVDAANGFEMAHPKYDSFKQDILNRANLLALEIATLVIANWFSSVDDHNDRRNCTGLRRSHLAQEDDAELAKVLFSDAHTIGSLGRNAAHAKKLTRFKMDSLDFQALRIALLDCTARVALRT